MKQGQLSDHRQRTRGLGAVLAGSLRVLPLCLLGSPAIAAPLLFQDAALFERRMDEAAVYRGTEGFEGLDAAFYKAGAPSFTVSTGAVSVSSTRFTVVDGDPRFVTEGSRAIKAVPGGWGRDHGWQMWDRANNSDNNAYGPLRLVFAQPINYLGLDITDLGTSDGQSVLTGSIAPAAGDPAAPFELLRAGRPHGTRAADCEPGSISCNDDGLSAQMFIGLYSPEPFLGFEIGLRMGDPGDGEGFVLDDFVGIDNLRFSRVDRPVPAPGSLLLLLPGLLLLQGARTCRRRAGARCL